MEKKTKYRIALAVALLLLIAFTFRTVNSYKALMEKAVYGRSDINSLRGWMSMRYVSRLYDADLDCLCEGFNVSKDECPKAKLYAPGGERSFSDKRRIREKRTPIFERVTLCQSEPPLPQRWMSMEYVSRLYGKDLDCICDTVGKDDCGKLTLDDCLKDRKVEDEMKFSSSIESCEVA